jgi:WD40 repeat protein
VLRSVSLDWKPDSHLLANADFGGDDGPAVRVWDADTGQLQFSVPIGGEMPIFDVAWNPNGDLLAIASNWSSVLIVDANTQQITQGLQGLGGSRAVAWRPDGLQVAAGDQIGNLGIWDTSTSQLLANIVSAHNGFIRQAAWSPSGSSLATISSEDNTLRIWDTSGVISPTGLPTTTPFPTLTPGAG